MEDDEDTEHLLEFETKSISSEDTTKVVQVAGNDLCVMSKDNNINEIAFTYENGNVVKMTLHELVCASKEVDPIAYVRNDGTVQSGFSDLIQFPLESVNAIEIRKTQGSLVNLFLRKI